MSKTFVILMMLFCHILDDFCLQKAFLSSMKQKNWWKRQEGYSSKYQNDYIAALVIHSYSWAFMVMLPIAIVQGFEVGTLFACVLILNASIHLLVDHVKANLMRINLVTDQFIHFIQIVLTFIVWNLKTL